MIVYFLVVAQSIIAYFFVRWLWERKEVKDQRKKAVFITDCNDGFGFSLGVRLAIKGIHVFAAVSDEESYDLVKTGSKSTGYYGGRLMPIRMDPTDEQSVRDAVKFVDDNLKDGEVLWSIIHTAGEFAAHGPDDWCTTENYQNALEKNCLSAIRITHALQHHIKACKGRLVFVSSVAGRTGLPYVGPYAVAQHAVEAYGETIRQELYRFGVKCSIVEPGVYRTPRMDTDNVKSTLRKSWQSLSQSHRTEYGELYKNELISGLSRVLLATGEYHWEDVTDCIDHAVNSIHPRSRYRCGKDATFFYIPISFLPAWLHDRAVRLGFYYHKWRASQSLKATVK